MLALGKKTVMDVIGSDDKINFTNDNEKEETTHCVVSLGLDTFIKWGLS